MFLPSLEQGKDFLLHNRWEDEYVPVPFLEMEGNSPYIPPAVNFINSANCTLSTWWRKMWRNTTY